MRRQLLERHRRLWCWAVCRHLGPASDLLDPSLAATLLMRQDDTRGIRETLGGHQGQVTTVKLLSENRNHVRLVSGDSAGEVRIWRRDANLVVGRHLNGGAALTPVVVVRLCARSTP